jgi:transcriptional regulator with XRE-family HTH domain
MAVTDIYSLSDIAIQQRIGDRLKSTRLRQNITQARLATDAQVSLSTIKKIEKGEISSFDAFIRLLRTLGKLDIMLPLVEEEQMSPNEYYEFVHAAKKKARKRATKSKSNTNKQEESEW